MGNTLEYVMKLNDGAFMGPLGKVRDGMRGTKSEADSMNQSLSKVGAMGSSSAGLGGLVAGMAAVQMATQKTEPLYKRLFHSMETGIGRTSRLFRVGGGITQIGAMLTAQLPGMTKFRAGLQGIEDKAHKLNAKLETLAGMGGKSSGGFGMRLMGGAGAGTSPAMASAAGAGGGAAVGGLSVAKMVGLGAALALVTGGLKSVGQATDFETLNTGFGVLIGNAETTKKVINDLQKVEKLTPFDMSQVMASGRTLLAFKESSDQVGDTLLRLSDISSGVNAPLNEMAELYGKARVNQTIFSEDLNQLTGRGVPAITEFAKILKVPEENIRKLAEQGKLTFPLLEQAFINLTSKGGQFFEMSKKQSETSKGMMSSLGSVMQQVMTAVGMPLNEHFLKPLMRDALALGPRVVSGVQAAMSLATKAAAGGKLGEVLSLSLRLGMAQFASFTAETLGNLAAVMGRLFNTPGDQVEGAIGGLAGGLIGVFEGMGDIIRAELGSAFNRVVSIFQGGLVTAVAHAMKAIGDIPVIGDKLGLSNMQVPSWQESSQQFYDESGGDMKGLKDQGRSKISAAFRTDDLKTQLEGIFAGLNVGQDMKKLGDAIAGVTKAGVEDGAIEGAKAKGIEDAIAKATEEGTKKGVKAGSKSGSGADKLDPNSRYDENGRRRSDGRKKIVSKRDGSTTAAEAEGSMTNQADISSQLFTMRQAGKFRKEGLPGFEVGSFLGKNLKPGIMKDAVDPEKLKPRLTPAMDGSTKAVQRRGFGTLDNPSGVLPNVKLTPPGTAKRQDTERRETAASQSRAGGGGGDKPRWDVVEQIAKHLANIATA